MDYQPREIEVKWQKYWEDAQTYKVDNKSDKPKFYVLDMFPYPSGAGLHVGHPLGYIASDIFSRYKRLKGFNVLHPMGYDAFGLPAEQYAIQTGVHPARSTDDNIKMYRKQLNNLGFSFDWSRQVKTSDPSYYKWTQWIFLQIFDHYFDNTANKAVSIPDLKAAFAKDGNAAINAATTQTAIFSADEWNAMSKKEQAEILMNYRLAYRKVTYVNWCEALGTVLANDEIKDGFSERGGHPVEKRPMLQWSLRITAYAERMIKSLDKLEWSDALKAMQKNWIGRSEGAQLFFNIADSEEQIEVFTTRADTIYGATYLVLAPEHPLVEQLTTPEQKAEVKDYLAYVNTRSDIDRQAEKKVTGTFLGAYANNPFTNKKIPIWIGEYVLVDYGTGAIMAVPSDDDRDKAFATKFGLEIIDVVDKSMYPEASLSDKLGKMINSDFLNGMEVKKAIKSMNYEIEKRGIGKKIINYKLRDANYSRQRYWGEPFPVQYDKEGIVHSMEVSKLPLELPDQDDFKPASSGKSPLARNEDWVNEIPDFTRETDTMPGFAGSSWYFLRYMDANNDDAFAGKEAIDYWQEVDLYVGGTEHAVGHLMYSRFWHKFLFDKGLVPTNEPFRKLINQGMIQGVIETMYLQKEKEEGFAKFACADIAKANGKEKYTNIPVHVDFVQNYGDQGSYLNLESIKQFIEWRPEFNDAIFECGNGLFHKGVFTPSGEEVDAHLITKSEVGKMSKRYFNVVNPDDVVARYGSDCFRMYEMFLGPVEQSKPWDTKGIDGVSKFLRKFWSLFNDRDNGFEVADGEPTKDELKVLHTAIKKVTEDIERFSFNTCVAAFMIATNDLIKLKSNNRTVLTDLVKLIAPFAPHMAEELWMQLGHEASVHAADYPLFDEKHLVEDEVEYPISINGKTRGKATFPSTASKDELEKLAMDLEVVKKWTEGKTVRKIIVVPKRMINVVVG
ncbi:MAG: leucyl-tRNA synthetase [Polaribacter sp.]|jgi:leucyl-tRNA synthetase